MTQPTHTDTTMNDLCKVTERIYIRPIQPTDVTSRYLSWFKDKSVQKYIEAIPDDLETLRAYVSEKSSQNNCVFLGVFKKESYMHIGNIKFEPIDANNGTSNFGILFAPDSQGSGLATEACRAALELAFEHLHLKRIELSVLEDNEKAISLYERLGFVQYGKRDHMLRGQIHRAVDMVLMPKEVC